jgi:SDR family mycofactocin-dependent oxidoreductase
MGKLEGKVAFITGSARGQGRSHAVRLAEEGADIVAVDVLQTSELKLAYPLATQDDLDQTVKLVENLGRRIIPIVADVRDADAMHAAAKTAFDTFGRIDIVLANAGLLIGLTPLLEMTPKEWEQTVGSNLTGHFHAIHAAAPYIIRGGRGGAIVLTASAAAMMGFPNTGAYTAAKTGVVGLMRVAAAELSQHNIRVNAICPTNVGTDFILNEPTYRVFCPDVENPTIEDVKVPMTAMHKLPIPWVEPRDVSNYIAWAVSDEGRYVTGSVLTVDAGLLL